MKKLIEHFDLVVYQEKYKRLAGLELDLAFLRQNSVYGFHKKGKLVGGFIIGYGEQFRTVETFVHLMNKQRVYDKLGDTKRICEVCGFWMDHKNAKNLWWNALVWLRIGLIVRSLKKDFVIFGTNNMGLAKMYGHPKKSLLFNQDRVENYQTYLYLARSKDFIWGILEIVLAKAINKRRNSLYHPKPLLQSELSYELSN